MEVPTKTIFYKRNSCTEIPVTKSTDNLKNLKIKTSDSSSRRLIPLTKALMNTSDKSFSMYTPISDSSSRRVISLTDTLKNYYVSEKSLSIESQPEETKPAKNINKYDELRADLNHLHLNLFCRKMSLESFRMNLRPKLTIQPPRDYVFKKNLVSFE